MTTFQQKDNTGSLFRNDKREKDSHPHAKGSAMIDGVEFWVSAWTKTDRNGNKFQSLAFKPKQPAPLPYEEGNMGAAIDDEIAF